MAELVTDPWAKLLSEGRYEEACQGILKALGPELRGYLRGVMGHKEQGDDLYQDLCAALWERLPSFEQRSSVRYWLYKIAHNLVTKRLQRYSHRRVVRLDTDAETQLPARSAPSYGTRDEAIAIAREQLTAAERELLIMRIERSFSFREVADILGITEATAKQRFHRLKEKLKGLIGPQDPS